MFKHKKHLRKSLNTSKVSRLKGENWLKTANSRPSLRQGFQEGRNILFISPYENIRAIVKHT
jgi:hypothetical protein